MGSDLNNRGSRWFIYAVAFFLGLALSLMLVFIVWNSTLEEKKREFIFEFSKIKETLAHNAHLSNDTIDSLSTFISTNKNVDDQILMSKIKGILDRQKFIEGIFYSPLLKSDKGQVLELPPEFKNYRFQNPYMSINEYDIRKDENYKIILKSLFINKETETVTSIVNLESKKHYVLLKPISNKHDTLARNGDPKDSIRGFFSLLINPDKLIEHSEIPNTLRVDLYSESSNLSGRKLIYSSIPSTDTRNGLLISNIDKEISIQFPSYSVKLSMSRDIFWKDINQELIYIVLLIGIGITLLLIALVRAKDLREKELSERNIVIELKVEEQTSELALARDKALQANRMKSDFLASMSHEIRTPLTAIIGMAELLSDTKMDDDQKKYVKIFRKAGDTLLSLVNDILDLSKIEAEQLVLEDIPFDLLDVVEESVEIYAIKAAERNVELISDIDPRLDIKRIGDPARLRQIILNLISNAIKFTENGSIVVMVRKFELDKISISVSDTGVGIPKEKQDTIFASFAQVDSSTTRKYGGTGLGLTISKQLVEMMGGRIWVESEEGKGSIFSFTINTSINELITRNDLYPEGFLKGKEAIILDNNEHNRIKITKVLNAFGAKCFESKSSLLMNQSLDCGISRKIFQYLFIDYKTLLECGDKEDKNLPVSEDNLMIIAMLEPVSLHQKINKINKSGITEYLIKPIKRSELLNVFLGGNGNTVEHISTLEQLASEKDEVVIEEKRILLVEDNEDNRLLVKTYLKKLPYVIDEAENGEVAVELYHRNIYNLVLMDVQMPVMDGHEATRAMRVIEAESGRPLTPIIALTAHAIKEEIDKCTAAGCDTHVGKPIKKSTLITIVKDFIT